MIYKLRRFWYGLSIALVALSIGLMVGFGLPLGIDFTGGNLAEIKPPADLTTEQVRAKLAGEGIEAIVQTTSNDTFIIKYAARSDGTLPSAQEIVDQFSGSSIVSFTSVGPAMGNSLQQKALLSVAVASLGIIIFLAWSFRSVGKLISAWSFGAFAVVAFIHDIVTTTGFITLVGHYNAQVSIDAYFLTALLTVLAYSVNDTIVVYDRVREVLWKTPSLPLPIAIERSIQQTVSRSLNTSLTIVLAVLPLILLAGGSLLTFLLTLAFGIIVGTYSSIFLAAPLLGTWQGWRAKPRRPRRPRTRRVRAK